MFKRIFLLLLLAAVTVCGHCADSWFMTTQGVVLSYVRRNVGDGTVKWYHDMTFEKVEENLSGKDVHYSSMLYKPNRKAMLKAPVGLRAQVAADGTVRMDLANSMKAVFASLFPNAVISTTGGITTLPSVMEPGDRLADASGTVKVRGITYTVSVTDRKVLRNEKITTPAGTFDCVVVSEHKEEKAVGYSRITTAETWYCRGYGMIRHDTYDRNMKLETSEILESVR